MAATLLSYFKDNLRTQGRSAKYLDRKFLAVFISEYNASHKTGVANYEKTAQTKFYNLNGGDYCAFLELYAAYKKGMEYLNNLM